MPGTLSRDDSSLILRVNEISKRITRKGMIKGLRDLSVLGKANRDLLTKIGFDLTLLDLATTKADELDAKYGAASCDSEDYLEVKFSSFFYRTVETVHGAVGEQENHAEVPMESLTSIYRKTDIFVRRTVFLQLKD